MKIIESNLNTPPCIYALNCSNCDKFLNMLKQELSKESVTEKNDCVIDIIKKEIRNNNWNKNDLNNLFNTRT